MQKVSEVNFVWFKSDWFFVGVSKWSGRARG